MNLTFVEKLHIGNVAEAVGLKDQMTKKIVKSLL
jgi:hypothetical protein